MHRIKVKKVKNKFGGLFFTGKNQFFKAKDFNVSTKTLWSVLCWLLLWSKYDAFEGPDCLLLKGTILHFEANCLNWTFDVHCLLESLWLAIYSLLLFTEHHRSRRRTRYPSDFTFINSWVKYSMFMFNFLFWLMGGKLEWNDFNFTEKYIYFYNLFINIFISVLLLGIGTYAIIDKWASGEGFR